MLLTAQSDISQTVKQSIRQIAFPVLEYYMRQFLGTKILFPFAYFTYFQGHSFSSVSNPNGFHGQVSLGNML